MENRFVAVLVLIPLCFIGLAAPGVAASVESFGEPLTEGLEESAIQKIVADPDAWVGKRVRVVGEVDAVCAMQGCWMDLVSEDRVSLRVKVDDGVIVFPPEAIGRQATAEGTVEIVEMEREQYIAWMRHVADEEGRQFDLDSIGDAPYRIVRLRGLGAEIVVR